MEILKRFAFSALFFACSVLASMSTVWLFTMWANYYGRSFWEGVAHLWMWLGGAISGIGIAFFLALAIVAIFLPTKHWAGD
jgi:hypothetical protein